MSKVKFRKPKYSNLLRKKLKSTFSKSSNLDVYLFLIEYEDDTTIPFQEVANYAGKPISAVKGAMRSARNEESIALALVDIGVRPEHIPDWFKESTFLVKQIKRKKDESPNPPQTTFQYDPIDNLSHVDYPAHTAKPKLVYYYSPPQEEHYFSPQVAAIIQNIINKMEAEIIRTFLARHKERVHKLTPQQEWEKLKAITRIQELWRNARAQEINNFALMFISSRLGKKTITVNKLLNFASKVRDMFVNFLNKWSRPTWAQILQTIDLTLLLQESPCERNQDELTQLKETARARKKQDLRAVAELWKEQNERNEKYKRAKHGDILRPIKRISYPWEDSININSAYKRKYGEYYYRS